MPNAEYGSLASQLAAEEDERRKERERYAAAMGVDPSAVGRHDVLLNQIRGPAPKVLVNQLGAQPVTTAPAQPTPQKPGMFHKFGALLGLLPLLR